MHQIEQYNKYLNHETDPYLLLQEIKYLKECLDQANEKILLLEYEIEKFKSLENEESN